MHCSPSPSPTEEIAQLRDLLRAQRAPKRRRQEESSASESDDHTDNHNVDNGNSGSSGGGRGGGSSSSSGSSNANIVPWVGRMICAPAGEQGHSAKEGHKGFINDDILRTAGITQQKWSKYMVSDINITSKTLLLIRYRLLHTDSLATTLIS